MLADLGAEVIKVENPGEGDYARSMGEGSDFFSILNRNKKSIALNLKNARGVEIFLRLATGSDVIIEGFRPGVVDALGIGYEAVRRVNPEIVYCSLSGYGQDGPYRLRAGHDINYISIAGILGLTGQDGGPPVVPCVQIGDVGAGSLMALSAILAALLGRERGKGGRYLDVSILDGLISWLPLLAADEFAGKLLARGRIQLSGKLACYNVYRSADGGYMSLGALEAKFWADFCQAIGRPDLVEKQYQPDQGSLLREISDIMITRTRAQWEKIFEYFDACCEPVLEFKEMMAHPQVKARDMITENSLAFPIKISGEPAGAPSPAPGLGEHTEEVLLAAGFSQEELGVLIKNKAV
jgi:crotonobetainyl-CoA:carnitine CoA-transferase CaiB-like acyl-CoA transferase